MAEEVGSRNGVSPVGRRHSTRNFDEEERDRESDKDRNKDNWTRKPRSLFLKRSDNGFGFTLRHFIVYPPESYTVLCRDRRLGLRGGDWDEPMDTIFVKNVRQNSPASVAGLANGDRIVSVNGETICGKSYAHVVQLIHQSPAYLHLLVVPKEDDLLQLYFGETAHNPETNPRPRLKSPEMVSGIGESRSQHPNLSPGTRHTSRLSSHQQQQHLQHNSPIYQNVWEDTRFHSPQRLPSSNLNASFRRASEGSKASFFSQQMPSSATSSSLPYGSNESMSNYSSPNMPGCRLSLDAGLINRDSNSRDSSESSLDSTSRDFLSSDDSLIMNRIRKSFEQKEEFLKRPIGPMWVGGGPDSISPKEFYARPQKLHPPIWPPTIPANSHHSPARKSMVTSDELMESGFICGGPVTNVPNQDLTKQSRNRGGGGFVTTLDRIQENGKTMAETSPPVLTVQPLSRLALVSQRAKQFESGTVETELPDRTSFHRSELARLSEKKSNPNVAVRKREFEAKSERKRYGSRESRSLDSAVQQTQPQNKSAKTNNELAVSSSQLPSLATRLAPPATHSETRKVPPTITSTPLSGNRTIPVGNAKLHCDPPPLLDDDKTSLLFDAIYPVGDKEQLRPRSNSAESTWPGDAWPNRHKAVRQDSYLQACHKPGRPASVLTDDSKTDVSPAASPNLDALSRVLDDNSPEDDKSGRRVSYIKATWNDRMTVDSEPDVSDSETTSRATQSVPVARKSLCSSDLTDKENHDLIKEGSLFCKLTLVDGKRASDRSWKQVWAVLKGRILYLYKERRDSVPLSETPLGTESSLSSSSAYSGSCEQVDMRCALVATADNYTKRKNVLRLNTIGGSELLLQADDAGQMARWIFALQEQANNNNSGDSITNSSLSPLPAHKGIKKFTSFRNRSPTGQSPVNKTRKPSQTTIEQLHPPTTIPSPKTKTWKGRVAKQFKRIGHGAGSPVSPSAPDTMHQVVVYPEGTTIGIPLEDCPMSSANEYVPLLVELCTGIVEERGLEIIGIYRVPGNTAAVSSLTEAVNRGLDASVLEQDPRFTDVNVISSLLKSFFRRLPNSLLTTELYPAFIQADKIDDPVLRMSRIRNLVHELPDHHFETLRYLLQHLKKVVDHCSVNKMEARNLAIVFGPTLIRTGDDNMVTMVTDMSHQCRIVESLILYVDWCFSDCDVDQLNLNVANDTAFCRPGSQSDSDSMMNHNLLLNNIHKVEGMKYDSAQKEMSARDIMSSIIGAANRKMQKAKSRKPVSSSALPSGTSQDVADIGLESRQSSGSVLLRQRLDTKAKALNRKERVTSASDDLVNEHTQSRNNAADIASSIRESILISGNIASRLPIESESDDLKQSTEPDLGVVDSDGSIRTYTGLSSATQERIRRFEMETKAMLQRDSSRARVGSLNLEENRDWEKQRIERDWHQSKRELESDDLSERIADNPTAIGDDIADQGDSTRRGEAKENLGDPNKGDVTVLKLNTGDCSTQTNGNLKRLKTGREQKNELLFNVSGSLDSLQGSSGSEQQTNTISDEGEDLLVSLTSTFDAKMRSLLSSNSTSEDVVQSDTTLTPPNSPNTASCLSTTFRDPSLHRGSSVDKSSDSAEEKDYDTKNESKSVNMKPEVSLIVESKPESPKHHCGTEHGCGENVDLSSNKENIHEGGKGFLYKLKRNNEDEFKVEKVNLRRSESLNRREDRKELADCRLRRSESLNKGEARHAISRLRRSESLNKSETRLKRSDSLKNEKMESSKRRQTETSRFANGTKLKRKNGVLSERSIKRRHTVGGTKDFDKVNWLDNRQRDADCEKSRKERRTSSPDLSSSRVGGILVELRPRSLADSNANNRLFNVPLESHV